MNQNFRDTLKLLDILQRQYTPSISHAGPTPISSYHHPPQESRFSQFQNRTSERPSSMNLLNYEQFKVENSLFSTPSSWDRTRSNSQQGEPFIDDVLPIYTKGANSFNMKNRLDQNAKFWKGNLVERDYSSLSFSKKIFIGGIPRDVTEEELLAIFRIFDVDVKIEWPESRPNSRNTPKGYLYVIFSSNENVFNLLKPCVLETTGGCETFNFPCPYKNFKRKPFQVIPWLTTDSHWSCRESTELERLKYTVFIGALHGRLHAKAVASIFDDVFGDVVSVDIDTDRYRYPIGSGRVTFATVDSYKEAIKANFIEINASKFSKRVQIEPCIDDQKCSVCKVDNAPNFCKESECFDYFCNQCWLQRHKNFGMAQNHVPIKRKVRSEH